MAVVASPFYEPGAPLPPRTLLVAETDIDGLSFNVTPVLHQDIDMSVSRRRTVRITSPPASTLQDRPMSRGSSRSPKDTSAEDDSAAEDDSEEEIDELSSLSSLDDDDDDGLVKITKPPGEAGRPGRGGYCLKSTLNWSETRWRFFRKVIAKLIAEHLDPKVSIAYQSEAQLNTVCDEALQRVPELAQYAELWPVTDAVKLRLKYTSSKARRHASIAVATSSQIAPRPRQKKTYKRRT